MTNKSCRFNRTCFGTLVSYSTISLSSSPVDILRGQLWRPLVYPTISLESDGKAEREEEASVPVDEDEDVEDDGRDSEGIREIGSRLCLLEELEHPVDLGFEGSLEVSRRLLCGSLHCYP